jgi:hypothetical protein
MVALSILGVERLPDGPGTEAASKDVDYLPEGDAGNPPGMFLPYVAYRKFTKIALFRRTKRQEIPD